MKVTLAGKGLSGKMRAFSSNLHKMRAFSSNLHKMCAFSWKWLAKIAKNKFSEIGLASSKGISSKDPKNSQERLS